ncbi:hypothetical protein [Streptomyces sp. cg2]|uniref:hypothetical protein n=1 Tax=Streptomyces sp. cg2 TaxID=3238799 RepID=UPI0034E22DF6
MRVPDGLFRRKSFRITAAAVAALVAAAGILDLAGVFDRWRDARALSRACDGIVPQTELTQLLNVDGGLTSKRAWDSSARDDRKCVIYRPREPDRAPLASLVVTLGQGRTSNQLLTDLDRNQSYDVESVSPIGSGWRGVLAGDRATVVMPCGRGSGDDLVVNLLTDPQRSDEGDGLSSPGQRARFARLATQTAVNAAERAGCQATPGKTIVSVPEAISWQGPALRPKEIAPPGKATGTCAGVDARTAGTAADPLAPIEDCFILDKNDQPRFRLAAYYGPFVQNGSVGVSIRHRVFATPAGGLDGLYWTSTACPKQGGTAFYTVETLRDDNPGFTKPDPAAERSALARFAERSARAHGCTPAHSLPATP